MTWKVINIADTGTASKFGGDDMDKVSKLFSAIDVDDVDINADWVFRDNKFKLRNPANTFSYIFSAGAIAANRTINLPVLTGSDTIAVLGLAQTFLQDQTIKEDTSDLLKLFRDSNTVNDSWGLLFDAKNSIGTQKTYGRVRSSIITNTDGLEDGQLRFSVSKAGSLVECARIDESGRFLCGGANRRIKFDETGLTAVRTFTFPDTDAAVVGTIGNQTITGVKTYSDQAIKLRNPANTFSYTLAHGAIAADRTITLPLASSNFVIPAYVQSGATVDTNTTAAEFDILNYSVVGNQLGANGSVRFTITGYLLQNDVTGTTYTFKVIFGGTTMYQDVTNSLAQNADKRAFRLTGELFNKNSTSAQGCSAQLVISDTGGATTGIGDISDDEILVNSSFDSEGADTTKDTTSSQTLQVTVTMSVSSASTHTVVKHSLVEVLPAA